MKTIKSYQCEGCGALFPKPEEALGCEVKHTDKRPQVGDMFVYTWGYDQTNVDAFQVERVTEKSMWLRPIATRGVPGTQGFMCQNVVPVQDQFTAPSLFRHFPRADKFAMQHGLCKKHVAGQSYFSSWYH